MEEKRYSIVRVDDKCPIIEDLGYCDDVLCDDCKFKENYGDTKEQLIRKVVQALLRRFKRIYKGKFITVEMARKQYLEVAKEIVESLGVK